MHIDREENVVLSNSFNISNEGDVILSLEDDGHYNNTRVPLDTLVRDNFQKNQPSDPSWLALSKDREESLNDPSRLMTNVGFGERIDTAEEVLKAFKVVENFRKSKDSVTLDNLLHADGVFATIYELIDEDTEMRGIHEASRYRGYYGMEYYLTAGFPVSPSWLADNAYLEDLRKLSKKAIRRLI